VLVMHQGRLVADGPPADAAVRQRLVAVFDNAFSVDMNPVLLKPEADTRSQVVLMGQVRADLTTMPWRERSALLWPTAREALASLQADCELLLIEGAGSPAEINLAASDFVNTATAVASQAACLLVSDIDRGGAFAHLYGTHALMDDQVQRQVRGFVLNRFRGDAALLAPGPQLLQDRTGVPTLAVVPMLRGHGLPEEDAVLAPPHISNLDEFLPLAQVPGVRLVWARQASQLEGADWVVLPGSKQVSRDLAWLRAQGAGRGAHPPRGRRRRRAGCVWRPADAGPQPARPARPRRPGRARTARPGPAAAAHRICSRQAAVHRGGSFCIAHRPLGRPGGCGGTRV
jgi:hypothetical protein